MALPEDETTTEQPSIDFEALGLEPVSDEELFGFGLQTEAPEAPKAEAPEIDYEALGLEPVSDKELFGFEMPKEEVQPSESFLRPVADPFLNIGAGINDVVKGFTDAFGADNAVSQNLAKNSEWYRSLLSAGAKQDQEEIGRIMQEAEGQGVLAEIGAGLKALSVAPVDLVSQGIGSLIPFIATAGVGKAVGLSKGGIAILQGVQGGLVGGGIVKGEIYSAVKEQLINSGVDEAKAEKAANEAQAYNGKNLDQIFLGVGLGVAASTTGADSAIRSLISRKVGKQTAEQVSEQAVQEVLRTGFVRGAAKSAAVEFATEGLQGGQEKLAANVAVGREGFDVDPMRGVVSQATLEGSIGALLAGGVGGVNAKVEQMDARQKVALRDAQKAAEEAKQSNAPASAAAVEEQINQTIEETPDEKVARLQREAQEAAGEIELEEEPPVSGLPPVEPTLPVTPTPEAAVAPVEPVAPEGEARPITATRTVEDAIRDKDTFIYNDQRGAVSVEDGVTVFRPFGTQDKFEIGINPNQTIGEIEGIQWARKGQVRTTPVESKPETATIIESQPDITIDDVDQEASEFEVPAALIEIEKSKTLNDLADLFDTGDSKVVQEGKRARKVSQTPEYYRAVTPQQINLANRLIDNALRIIDALPITDQQKQGMAEPFLLLDQDINNYENNPNYQRYKASIRTEVRPAGQAGAFPETETEVAAGVRELEQRARAEAERLERARVRPPVTPTAAEPPTLAPLRRVAKAEQTEEDVSGLVGQGLVELYKGQPVITQAGLEALPEAERPRLTPEARKIQIDTRTSEAAAEAISKNLRIGVDQVPADVRMPAGWTIEGDIYIPPVLEAEPEAGPEVEPAPEEPKVDPINVFKGNVRDAGFKYLTYSELRKEGRAQDWEKEGGVTIDGSYYPTAVIGDTKVAFTTSGLYVFKNQVRELYESDVDANGNTIFTIQRIVTPEDKRGQGSASKAIAQITDAADKAGLTLQLQPAVISTLVGKGGELSAKQLVDWYKRNGFVQKFEGSDAVLIRSPKQPAIPEVVPPRKPDAEPQAAADQEIQSIVEKYQTSEPTARMILGNINFDANEAGVIPDGWSVETIDGRKTALSPVFQKTRRDIQVAIRKFTALERGALSARLFREGWINEDQSKEYLRNAIQRSSQERVTAAEAEANERFDALVERVVGENRANISSVVGEVSKPTVDLESEEQARAEKPSVSPSEVLDPNEIEFMSARQALKKLAESNVISFDDSGASGKARWRYAGKEVKPQYVRLQEAASVLAKTNLRALDAERINISGAGGRANRAYAGNIFIPRTEGSNRSIAYLEPWVLLHEVGHTLTSDAFQKYVPDKGLTGADYYKQLKDALKNKTVPRQVKRAITLYIDTIKALGFEKEYFKKGGLASNNADRGLRNAQARTTNKLINPFTGQQITTDDMYALADMHEFYAQAWNSESFQDILKQIKVEPQKSAFQKFVDIIKDILGFESDTMAYAVIDTSLRLASLESPTDSGATVEDRIKTQKELRAVKELPRTKMRWMNFGSGKYGGGRVKMSRNKFVKLGYDMAHFTITKGSKGLFGGGGNQWSVRVFIEEFYSKGKKANQLLPQTEIFVRTFDSKATAEEFAERLASDVNGMVNEKYGKLKSTSPRTKPSPVVRRGKFSPSVPAIQKQVQSTIDESRARREQNVEPEDVEFEGEDKAYAIAPSETIGKSLRDVLRIVSETNLTNTDVFPPSEQTMQDVAAVLAQLDSPVLDSETVVSLESRGYGRDGDFSARRFPDGAIGVHNNFPQSVEAYVHEASHSLTVDQIDRYLNWETSGSGKDYINSINRAIAAPATPEPVKRLFSLYTSTLDQLGLMEQFGGVDGVANWEGDARYAKQKAQARQRSGKIRKDLDYEQIYGLVDMREFVAQTFSSESFRDLLKTLKDPNAPQKSLWSAFVEAIQKILNLPKSSMAAAVIQASVDISTLGEVTPKRTGAGVGAIDREVRVTPQQDRDYLDAVERGDLDAASRVVEDLIRASGAVPVQGTRVYRGSVAVTGEAGGAGVGSTLGSGVYVTSNRETEDRLAALDYAGGKFTRGADGNIQEFLADLDNAFILDTDKRYDLEDLIADERLKPWFRNRLQSWLDNGWYSNGLNGGNIVALIQGPPKGHGKKADIGKAGFDAVVTFQEGEVYEAAITNPEILKPVETVLTREGVPQRGTQETLVQLPSGEIKSADPVTYDDQGNPIPPSQRFQQGEADIRYSRREPSIKIRQQYAPKTDEEQKAFEKATSNKVMARNPQLAVAAVRLKNGQITAGEYADLVDSIDPFVPKGADPIPSDDKIKQYIQSDKVGKVGFLDENGKPRLNAGDEYEFRIDINTYNRSTAAGDTVYNITAHESVPETSKRVGEAYAYVGVAKVTNPTFMTRAISGKGSAIEIAIGKGKFPLATVKGNYEPITELPADINDPNVWTEVGYNPIRSSFFVDVRSKKALVGGTEAIMVGSRVFVKNAQLEARPTGVTMGERYARRATQPTVGMTTDAVRARLEALGFGVEGMIRIVEDPQAAFEGRTIIQDGKAVRIELNASALNDNAAIDRVLNHEFAEAANADGALNKLVERLTPKEKKEINDAITRLGYEERVRTTEEAARAIETLAAAWKGRGFFERAVARIQAWGNKLGFKLTRKAAEYIAARNLSDVNAGFKAAYEQSINVVVEDERLSRAYRMDVPTQEELDARKAKLPKYTSETKPDNSYPERSYIVIFDEKGERVGRAVVEQDIDDAKILTIRDTLVYPRFIGKGYGEALYREVAKFAQQNGMTSIFGGIVSEDAQRVRAKLFQTKYREIDGIDSEGGQQVAMESNINPDIRYSRREIRESRREPAPTFTEDTPEAKTLSNLKASMEKVDAASEAKGGKPTTQKVSEIAANWMEQGGDERALQDAITENTNLSPANAAKVAKVIAKQYDIQQSIATAFLETQTGLSVEALPEGVTLPKEVDPDRPKPVMQRLFDVFMGVRVPPVKIEVNEKTALKQQIRLKAAANRAAKAEQKRTAEEVVEIIKAMELLGPVRPKQVQALAKRAARVIWTNEKSVEAFSEYAAKVVENANYDADLRDAKDAQKRAKQLSTQKKVAMSPQREVLEDIGKIPVNKLDDPRMFAEAVNYYLRGFKAVLSPDYVVIPDAEMESYLSGAQSETLRNQRDLDREANERLANKYGIDPDQVNEMMESIDIIKQIEAQENREALENLLTEKAIETQQGLRGYNIDNLRADQRSIVSSMLKVDPKALDPEERQRFIRITNNIIYNNQTNGAEYFVAVAKGQQSAREAAQDSTMVAKNRAWINLLPRFVSERMQRGWALELQSIADTFRNAFGKGAMAKMYDAMGMLDLNLGFTKANNTIDKIQEQIAEFHRNLEKKYKAAARNQDGLLAEGVVGFLIQSVPKKDEVTSINQRRDLIRQDIANRRRSTGEPDKVAMADRIETILNQIDGESVGAILNNMKREFPANHESLVWYKDTLLPQYKDFLKSFDENFNDQANNYENPNYLTIGFTSAGPSLAITPEEQSLFYDQVSLRPKQSAYTIKRVDYSEIPKDRTTGKPKEIEFNLRRNVFNGLSDQINKAYTSSSWQRIASFMKTPEAEIVFGGAANKDFFIERLNRLRLSRMRRGSMGSGGAIEKAVDSLSVISRKLGTGIALGGIYQWIKQPPDQLITAWGSGGRADLLSRNIAPSTQKAARELLNKFSIGRRGDASAGYKYINQMEGHQNRLERYFSESKWDQAKEQAGKIADVWMVALKSSDFLAASAAWMTYYEGELNKQDIKIDDWSKEAELIESDPARRQAAAFAEQMTDIYQGSSDPTSMATFAQSGKTGWENFVKALLVPFNSFAIQQRMRLYSDARDAINGSKSGAGGLAGTVGGLILFHTTKRYAIPAISGAGIGILYGLMGVDMDEPDEEKQKEEANKNWRQFLADITGNLLVGGTPQIVESQFIDAMNRASYLVSLQLENDSILNEDGEIMSYDQYSKERSPFYRYKSFDNAMSFGMFDIGIGQAKQVALQTKMLATPEEMEMYTPEEQRLLYFSALSEWLYMMRLNDADFARLVGKARRDMMKAAKDREKEIRAIRSGR